MDSGSNGWIKRRSPWLLLLVAAALAGCAAAPGGPATEIDYAKIGAVERRAQQLGVRIHWIHPPTRPASAAER